MAKNHITINLDPLLKSLDALQRKNLPYAQAVALNNTAFQAKAALISDLPDRFDLRSKRIACGFRVEKANKKQAIPQATVYHLDNWMTIHEFGGDKEPAKSKRMSIPATEVQSKGRTSSGKIGNRWKASAMRRSAGFADPAEAGKQGGRGKKGKGNPKAFLMTSKDGERRIVRRTSRGGNRYDLIDLYYLKPKAKIEARWGYMDTVTGIAAHNLGMNFQHALAAAVASSTK